MIKTIATSEWGFSDNRQKEITLDKLDVAIDLMGSFIPTDFDEAQKTFRAYLQGLIESNFNDQQTDFLRIGSSFGLKVNRGDNILPTSFQFTVLDQDNSKLLNIKVYDKMLDLFGREGIQ